MPTNAVALGHNQPYEMYPFFSVTFNRLFVMKNFWVKYSTIHIYQDINPFIKIFLVTPKEINVDIFQLTFIFSNSGTENLQ